MKKLIVTMVGMLLVFFVSPTFKASANEGGMDFETMAITVKKDDTMVKIASRHKVSSAIVIKLNWDRFDDVGLIRPGDTVLIPAPKMRMQSLKSKIDTQKVVNVPISVPVASMPVLNHPKQMEVKTQTIKVIKEELVSILKQIESFFAYEVPNEITLGIIAASVFLSVFLFIIFIAKLMGVGPLESEKSCENGVETEKIRGTKVEMKKVGERCDFIAYDIEGRVYVYIDNESNSILQEQHLKELLECLGEIKTLYESIFEVPEGFDKKYVPLKKVEQKAARKYYNDHLLENRTVGFEMVEQSY